VKVLVTGSSGFIGGHLAAELAKQGHDVFCLVRRTSVFTGLEGLKITRVLGDTRNKLTLAAAVKGMDYVFHLAGVIDAADPDTYFEVNTEGTRNLLDSCLAVNPGLGKLVFVSSVSAAGPSPCGRALDEADECRPVSDYGRSKLEAEKIVLARKDSLSVTVVRPPNVLGPRQKELTEAIRLIRKRILPIIGTADTRTSILSVQDLVRALILAAEDPRSAGRTYFVTDGRAYSWREITRAVAGALGVRYVYLPVPFAVQYIAASVAEAAARLCGTRPAFLREHVVDARKRCWVYDGSRIQRELGFEPTMDMKDAVRSAVAWYREHGAK
jgi:nucleoside-diphosphate-sugar epimerase